MNPNQGDTGLIPDDQLRTVKFFFWMMQFSTRTLLLSASQMPYLFIETLFRLYDTFCRFHVFDFVSVQRIFIILQ